MKEKSRYIVIGMMSGTSLDGLDIAACEFTRKGKWSFKILSARTYLYSPQWRTRLSTAHHLSPESLLALHNEYGDFLGSSCVKFMQQHKIKAVDFIASHGHTIFHQPNRKFTFQLGSGTALHVAAGLPVVFDFRSQDIALGGEGAPLVPMGDKVLLRQYDYCLNLGGIANISMDISGRRKAFDICFCNMGLNYLMNTIGQSFDKNGKLTSSGIINETLLRDLSDEYKSYYKSRPSLGREMFETSFQPLLEDTSIPLADRLRTVCESSVNEIVKAIPTSKKKMKLLATGGGALNGFFISLLKDQMQDRIEVIIPERKVIEFKEALVFAFLGVLRVRNQINVLSSVTKAAKDSSGGTLVGSFN